jgi:hypothetical protein
MQLYANPTHSQPREMPAMRIALLVTLIVALPAAAAAASGEGGGQQAPSGPHAVANAVQASAVVSDAQVDRRPPEPLDLRLDDDTAARALAGLPNLVGEEAQTTEVTVEGPRAQAPVPEGAFRAVPWALTHPAQAWRIFAPVTD